MIKEVKMYTVVCDNCGEDIGSTEEYSCWNDEGYALDNAIESDWIEEEGNHYCPDCVQYDDNDKLILKEITKI